MSRKRLAVMLASVLVGFSFGPVYATEQTPVFQGFSTDDCVRDPHAVFSIPQGLNPLGFVAHVTPSVSFGWSIWRSGTLSSEATTFEVPLQRKSRINTDNKFIRAAFTFPGTGTFSTPVEIPTTLVMMDSEICNAKRAEQAELERLAKLPRFQALSLQYLGTSNLQLDFVRSDKNSSKRLEYQWTRNGLDWSAANPVGNATVTVSNDDVVSVRFVDSVGLENITAIRVRGQNDFGTGDWHEFSTGRPQGSSRIAVETQYQSLGLVLVTNPILLPTRSRSTTARTEICSVSTVELIETEPSSILAGDLLTLETSIEERELTPNSAYPSGQKNVSSFLSGHNPERTSLNVSLCPRELEFTPRYLRVKVTNVRTGVSVEGKMEVVQPAFSQSVSDRVRVENTCLATNVARFGTNVTLEQTRVQKSAKANGAVRGTLFRSGFVAPSQKFFVYQKSGKNAKLIHSSITDPEGQFAFTFSLPVKKAGTKERLYLVLEDASGVQVPLASMVQATETELDFKWEKTGLRYVASPSDWIPSHASNCVQSLPEAPSFFEGDEKNHVAWFIAKRVYYGMKGKQSRSSVGRSANGPTPLVRSGSSIDTGVSIGKRCYVRGYTTKSGKRVSGYYRRC